MVVIAIGRAGTTESNRALHLYRCFHEERNVRAWVHLGTEPEFAAPILRRVVFAFRSTLLHGDEVRGKKREKTNAVTGRTVICVCKGERWKREGGKKERRGKRRDVRCALGVTESAKYNPERLEVMIDRWRIEGSCPATFLRVPSQGHSTPWNPEPAWNRAVVAELFRLLAAVASKRAERRIIATVWRAKKGNART